MKQFPGKIGNFRLGFVTLRAWQAQLAATLGDENNLLGILQKTGKMGSGVYD